MEIWASLIDVSQRRNLEYHFVIVVLCHLEASRVTLIRPRFDHAEFPIGRPANIGTVMARLAAGCDEGVEACFFCVGQSRCVSVEESIPTRRSDQLALECPDG